MLVLSFVDSHFRGLLNYWTCSFSNLPSSYSEQLRIPQKIQNAALDVLLHTIQL